MEGASDHNGDPSIPSLETYFFSPGSKVEKIERNTALKTTALLNHPIITRESLGVLHDGTLVNPPASLEN